MNKKYIKLPIPAEISDQGGAVARFVEKETVPLDTSIQEAIQGRYTMGQETLVKNLFVGMMKSMIDGLLRDGHARTLAGLLTVYLVVKGEFDLEKGWDDEKNSLRVRARLLNELDLDITKWVFEDVTPGKRAFTLSTIKAGDVKGVYEIGRAGELNGNNLPNTELGEEIRVDWEVEGTDKSGTLDAAKVSSDATRIDVQYDALDELKDEEYDGKKIVFTVRGNFSNYKKSATIKYVEPPVPELTKVVDEAHEGSAETTWGPDADTGFMFGSGLTSVTRLGIMKYTEDDPEGEEFSGMIVGEKTDSKLKFEILEVIGDDWTKLVFFAEDAAGHRSEVTLEHA